MQSPIVTQALPTMQQYLVRTSPVLSQIDTILPAKEQMAQFASLNRGILDLLPREEREGVLKYFFPADAAMSLVSGLLKHLIIAETIGMSFEKTVVSRHPGHGKPCYKPPTDSSRSESESRSKSKAVSFNVSHQAGLVALIAIPEDVHEGREDEFEVGTDVVCVNERNELEKIMDSEEPRREWNGFVDMHGEVFSPKEIERLKMERMDEGSGVWDNREIGRRMRRFFALWCLREAWVKMTGEALLAEWLGELEFRLFPVPGEIEEDGSPMPDTGEDEGFEIYFKGERVRNVEMKIASLGRRYMVASAVRRKDERPVDVPWTELEEISVEEVVRRVRAAV